VTWVLAEKFYDESCRINFVCEVKMIMHVALCFPMDVLGAFV
jgi:hypothetical protein